jgi:hypothetical protein
LSGPYNKLIIVVVGILDLIRVNVNRREVLDHFYYYSKLYRRVLIILGE